VKGGTLNVVVTVYPWKSNNSLLSDIEFLRVINTVIEDIKRQYCIPIYNLDTLNEIEDSQIQFVINDQLFLETLLMEIRGKTISYSSHRAKLRRTQESILISKIEILEQSLTEENKDLLITLKMN